MPARRDPTILVLLLIVFSMLQGASVATGDTGGGVEDDQVFADTYFAVPGTGEWASFDTGIPNDPFEYKFELKCFDDLVGYIDCLYEHRNACTAGEGGRLVYWFYSFKGDNVWELLDRSPSCIYSEKPEDTGDRIRGVILSEFQARSIAPSLLNMQPSPHTLIGAHTNFYVETDEQVFDFVLFEQNIRIAARPTEYEWNYGDGIVHGPTRFAGGPLPADRWGEETTTSHVYRATGDYQASVVTYFSAEYSINGGPMVPIDGRATVPSAPQTISVWKSESRNVADDCLVNPAGFGC